MSKSNDELQRAARAMRYAYAMHEDGRPPTSWEVADPDKREAWIVCAEAAARVLRPDLSGTIN